MLRIFALKTTILTHFPIFFIFARNVTTFMPKFDVINSEFDHIEESFHCSLLEKNVTCSNLIYATSTQFTSFESLKPQLSMHLMFIFVGLLFMMILAHFFLMGLYADQSLIELAS